ncbi:MAG: hypothetical protein HQK83_07795 [Fibrobacteria bacterium]|nr:hypothetical protein [Fibrobacteria bacterium]
MNVQLKSYLIIIITLVVGMVIGAMGYRAVLRHGQENAIGHMFPGGPGGPGMNCPPGGPPMGRFSGKKFDKHEEKIKNRMRMHLDLSDSQWTQMEPIIDSQIAQFRGNMDKHRRQIRAMVDSIELKVSPMLTTQQVQKFKEIKARRVRGPDFRRGEHKHKRDCNFRK